MLSDTNPPEVREVHVCGWSHPKPFVGAIPINVRPAFLHGGRFCRKWLFLIEDPATVLGFACMESYFAGEISGRRARAETSGPQSTKANPGKPWIVFFDVVPKPSNLSKQSHKGGCPQEALILFNVTVYGACFTVQLFGGLGS